MKLFNSLIVIFLMIITMCVYWLLFSIPAGIILGLKEFVLAQPLFSPESSVFDVVKTFSEFCFKEYKEFILLPYEFFHWLTTVNWI